MDTALVGLAGILIGMLITEHFRKRSRIENFSSSIFEKRLAVYEKLMEEFQLAFGVVNSLYEDDEKSLEEKHAISVKNGFKLMQFTEENDLYLNDEVTVHIGMLFVGTGNIFLSDKTEKERKDAYEKFSMKYGETKKLIKKASGVLAIDDLITKVTDSEPESIYISQFRKLKKKYERTKNL